MNKETLTHLQEAEHHLSLARFSLRDAANLLSKKEQSDLTEREHDILNIAAAIESYGIDLFMLNEEELEA